jgi:ubiquinone/menaquinone biosynthesis C-methylase UbiE
MPDDAVIPNHHRDFPAFSGFAGLLGALSMSFGRDGDARFAAGLGSVGPNDAVVDIGCGPGVAVRYAAGLGASCVGVDPAAVMLRTARRLTRSSSVQYLEGTAEALPIADASVSVAWSIATVHHWNSIDQGLGEVRRVLRSGGCFIAIERLTHAGATGHASHGWTDEQAQSFADACHEHGFIDVRIEHGQRNSRQALVAVVATCP